MITCAADHVEAVAVSLGDGDALGIRISRIRDGGELLAARGSDTDIWSVGSNVFFLKTVIIF